MERTKKVEAKVDGLVVLVKLENGRVHRVRATEEQAQRTLEILLEDGHLHLDGDFITNIDVVSEQDLEQDLTEKVIKMNPKYEC